MRTDTCLTREPAVVPDERRAFDLVEIVDVDALADPDVAAQLDPGDVELDGAVEGVIVRLQVLSRLPMSCQ